MKFDIITIILCLNLLILIYLLSKIKIIYTFIVTGRIRIRWKKYRIRRAKNQRIRPDPDLHPWLQISRTNRGWLPKKPSISPLNDNQGLGYWKHVVILFPFVYKFAFLSSTPNHCTIIFDFYIKRCDFIFYNLPFLWCNFLSFQLSFPSPPLSFLSPHLHSHCIIFNSGPIFPAPIIVIGYLQIWPFAWSASLPPSVSSTVPPTITVFQSVYFNY